MRRRLAVACPVVLAVAAMLLQGCALTTHFAYTNTTLARTENKAPQASFEIKRRTRQHGDVLVDRKSTRLNSSHSQISYAVFCLKKKKKPHQPTTPRTCPPHTTL